MLSRRLRKFAASIAILGLLFAQLMVAAYACPRIANASPAQAEAAASLPPCHRAIQGGDGGNEVDGLCAAHCQEDGKIVAAAHNPASADFVPAFIVRLDTLPQWSQSDAGARLEIPTPHHSPPILLRTGCLRI
jgi:hypothetical protein